MASNQPSNPSSDQPGHPHHPPTTHHEQWASHLAELGAMSQLYAHEVNNLLTQVSARAQLALMRPNDSELSEHALRTVGDCCQRIEQLTQIFLAPASASHTTSSPIAREPIQTIHNRVMGTLRESDRAQFGLTLDDESLGYAPDLLPIMLEQVLQNLILNALRAIAEHPTPHDSAHQIRISTRLRSKAMCSTWNIPTAEHALEITVEDTGIGMHTDQITQLMNGLRVDLPSTNAPTAERFNRHGLGIRVCQKLLGAMGGAMDCDSSPMQGTRMIVRVPAVRLQDDSTRRAA